MKKCLFLFVLLLSGGNSLSQNVYTFIGPGTDYQDLANWSVKSAISTGSGTSPAATVPGAAPSTTDIVIIPEGSMVILNPATDNLTFTVSELYVKGNLTIRRLTGTNLSAVGLKVLNNMDISNGGEVVVEDNMVHFAFFQRPTDPAGQRNQTFSSPQTSTATAYTPVTAYPVTLEYFKVTTDGQSHQLSWKTSQETGFHYFEIQKSNDARFFETVGRVNQNIEKIYSWPLADKSNELSYFRLKLVDMDNTFDFSKIIRYLPETLDKVYSVYPNPIKNSSFRISGLDKGTFFSLVDMNGRQVFFEKSVDSFQIDPNFHGIAVLKIKSQGFLSNKVLVVE